jgi:hypothetical protein
MSAALFDFSQPAGMSRLLAECEAVDRADGARASSASSRLEQALGSDFARRLVSALARGGRRPSAF